MKIHKESGAISVGLEAVKFAFLLNGAGAIALVGFLTSESVQRNVDVVLGIASALTYLAIGAALAPLVLFLAYAGIHAQYHSIARYERGQKPYAGISLGLLIIAIVAGGASIGLFIYAIWTLGPVIASGVGVATAG